MASTGRTSARGRVRPDLIAPTRFGHAAYLARCRSKRLEEDPQLTAPTLVAALEGWVDAGAAGTTAAAQLFQRRTLVATSYAVPISTSGAPSDPRHRRRATETLTWAELRLTASASGTGLLV